MFMEKIKKNIAMLIILAFGFNLFSPLLIHAAMYVSISGKVIDINTGKGMFGIYVIPTNMQKNNDTDTTKTIFVNTTPTKSDGSYIIYDVLPGTYELTIIDEYNNYQIDKKIIKVNENAHYNNVNIEIGRGCIITGKIFQYDSITPAENVSVIVTTNVEPEFYFSTHLGLSSKTGNYSVEKIKPASLASIFAKPNNGLATVIVNIYEKNKLKKGVISYINFVLGNPKTCLIGKITDSKGQPISGIKIKVMSSNCMGEAVTDSNGYYEIKGLKIGIYSLKAEKEEYEEVSIQKNIKIIERKKNTFNVILK